MAYLPNVAAWTKYTKAYTDFSTAAVTNSVDLFTLQAKEVIHMIQIVPTVAFAGGLIATYTVSVGIVGVLAKYAIAANAFTGFTLPTINALPGLESTSGTTAIKATAVSTVGNLNAATAGSVDIYVLKSTLP